MFTLGAGIARAVSGALAGERQLLGQLFQEVAPSRFADLRTIRALKERALMCANEVSSFVRRQELDRDQRGRDAITTEGHRRSSDNAPVGHDVLMTPLVRNCDALERGAFLETIPESLGASDAKIHLELLNFMMIAPGEPA